MNEETIHRYVDAAAHQLLKQEIRCVPVHVPEEMKDHDIPIEDDEVGWKPIPSTVTDTDLNTLEVFAGANFPPAYRTFLKYRHFYDLTEVGVRFSSHAVDTWRDTLEREYMIEPKERIVGIGLIPFGSEAMMDAGPVCFDTRGKSPDGDCPVVYWDHEWVGTEKEIQPMFSSCMKMFECLLFVATSEIYFVYHDEDDPSNLLHRKRELMAQFLNTDPGGAGGPAREYWTSWGVDPDAS